jgi:glutaredoxin
MDRKRRVQIFSAGCPVCDETVETIRRLACPSCEVTVLDMGAPAVATMAKSLGIASVPAVVIDGQLADCCKGRGPNERVLLAAGVGRPI